MDDTSQSAGSLTPGQFEALSIAIDLARYGVPIFTAPAADNAVGFALPAGWQRTEPGEPSVAAVRTWLPGMALCAVGGGPVDFLDVDPRNGGQEAVAVLDAGGMWPRSYGMQLTPSGGAHYLVQPLGIGKYQGKGDRLSGLDLQGGRADGSGRGFVFLAPTERRSKIDGTVVAYRWEKAPEVDQLREWAGTDDSGQELAGLILGAQVLQGDIGQDVRYAGSQTGQTGRQTGTGTAVADPFDAAGATPWTEAQALAEIKRALSDLERARPGTIESTLNATALYVGRFQDTYWPDGQLRHGIKRALERGGHHSDEWNKRNGLGWTADSKIDHAFRDAREKHGLFEAVPEVPLDGRSDAVTSGQTGPDGTDGYTPIDWSELFGRDWSAIDWHLGRFVERGQQMSLIGDGKSGKSLIMLEWAWRLAAGLPWLGDVAHEPATVLYVDRENSQDDLYRRLIAYGATPDQLGRLRYQSFPPYPPLDTEAGAAVFLGQVAEHGAQIVIMDTVSRFVQGKENESDTWLAFYRLVHAKLKAAGITGVRLDHFGKDAEKGGRGSSAKSQDIDHVWEMSAGTGTQRMEPDGAESGPYLAVETQVTLTRTHTRSGRGHDVLALVRSARKDAQGDDWIPGHTRHEAGGDGVSGAVWIAAHQIAQMLDEMGVPQTAGRDRCRQLLKGKAMFDNALWMDIKRYRGSSTAVVDIVPIPDA